MVTWHPGTDSLVCPSLRTARWAAASSASVCTHDLVPCSLSVLTAGSHCRTLCAVTNRDIDFIADRTRKLSSVMTTVRISPIRTRSATPSYSPGVLSATESDHGQREVFAGAVQPDPQGKHHAARHALLALTQLPIAESVHVAGSCAVFRDTQDSKKAKLPIVDDGGKLIALMSRS